jgi:TolB-like protein
MILKHKVSVQRYVTGTPSPSGSPTTILSTLVASLKCDLQPHQGVVVVPVQGQTTIYYKNMFCNIVDIQANDIITDLATGEKFKVVNTNPWNILKHLEVFLQGGTVK